MIICDPVTLTLQFNPAKWGEITEIKGYLNFQ